MTVTATGHSYIDAESGTRLDVWYPPEGIEPKRTCLAERLGLISSEIVTTTIDDLDEAPTDSADAYLRLHLLSRRSATPNSISVDGIFGHLANVAWTSAGPVAAEKLDHLRAAAGAEGHTVIVRGVDKFPHMADYVAYRPSPVAGGAHHRSRRR